MSSAPGARHRILVDGLAPGTREVTGESVRYVRNVLRAEADTEIGVFDGLGRFAVARLLRIERDRLLIEVGPLDEQPEPRRRVTLAVAVPKRDRADWLVEKIAELGVGRLAWLQCDRSVSVPRTEGGRAERWQRIAREASRQCGRSDLLEIIGPLPLETWLETPQPDTLCCVATPDAEISLATLAGRSAARGACVVVGPEGGLTGHELGQAKDAGYTEARMGVWTLRVETAAVTAAAMLIGD